MSLDRGITRLALAVALAVALGAAGCVAGAGAPGSGGASVAAAPTAAGTTSSSPEVTPVPSPVPSRFIPRVSLPPAPVDPAAVPGAIVAAVLADASGRTGVAAAAITFLRAEATTWPSGALGCPEPGQMYTEALVPGYWLVVEAGGQRLDYRATESGAFKLCANPPGPG